MKSLSLMSGKEYIVEDDEAENIKQILSDPGRTHVELRDGTMFNKLSVSSIGEPDTLAVWDGYPLDKGGKSFMRDGERCYLEPHNFSQIEYKLHPKYGKGLVDIPRQEEKLIEAPHAHTEKNWITQITEKI